MRIFKAFALIGRRAKCCLYPGCCPGLGASALSGRVGQWLLLFAFCFAFCFKNYLKIRVVSLSLSNSSLATACIWAAVISSTCS